MFLAKRRSFGYFVLVNLVSLVLGVRSLNEKFQFSLVKNSQVDLKFRLVVVKIENFQD